MSIILSKNGVQIRLTDERWMHITEQHTELMGLREEVIHALSQPERILAGGAGELLAVREWKKGKFLIVIYRELAGDGFIITAFLTRRVRSLEGRKQLWP